MRKIIVLCLIVSILFPSFAYAKKRDKQYYINVYNSKNGTVIITKEKIKEKEKIKNPIRYNKNSVSS